MPTPCRVFWKMSGSKHSARLFVHACALRSPVLAYHFMRGSARALKDPKDLKKGSPVGSCEVLAMGSRGNKRSFPPPLSSPFPPFR